MTCLLCNSTQVEEFLTKNRCTIYTCTECRLRFVYPIPDTETVYGKDYFTGAEEGFGYVDYDKDKEPMIPAFGEYLIRARKFMPEADRLLDVGAATGFFVRFANEQGFKASGVELSKYAAEEGAAKGLDMTTGTIHELLPEREGMYDVITMLDVIEHVPDPSSDIRAAGSLLVPGGLLMINTPDTGSLYAKVMRKRWHLLTPPEHLVYFNRKNLSTLLTREGFETVWVGTIGKRFTLSYIFRTLYGWQGIRLWHTLARITERGLFARIALPINLGDNLFLIARKYA